MAFSIQTLPPSALPGVPTPVVTGSQSPQNQTGIATAANAFHFSHPTPSIAFIFVLYLVSSISLILLSITVLEYQSAVSGSDQQTRCRIRMLAALFTYLVLLGVIVTLVLF